MISMNLRKFLSPDFTFGKMLVTLKAIFDILVLCFRKPSKDSIKYAILIGKVKPKFTMIKNKNLINLYRLVQEVNRYNVPGDIVECGVWNGGSAAIMGVSNFQGEYSRQRTIWLFDSFQGLPRPSANDGDKEKKEYFIGWNIGDIKKVKQIFVRLGLNLDNVRIIPGWFESTLKMADIESIAVLHIDADWYNSVSTVLKAFYEKVVPGGFIIFDDYGYWQGCTQAVKDFLFEQARDDIFVQQIGNVGAFFQKPFGKRLSD